MITVNGQTTFNASAEFSRFAMLNQAHLEKFLPPESTITKVDEQTFDFLVVKDIGIIGLKLAGTLTVAPTDTPGALQFKAQAKHALTGTMLLDLILTFEGTETECRMSHSGSVEATGLIGKALTMSGSKVQGKLDAMFQDFGARMARMQTNRPTRKPR